MSQAPKPGTTATLLDPDRQKLLAAKLGSLLTWRPPEIVKTVGPFDPEPFARHEAARVDLVEACQAKLTRYSVAEVALVRDPLADQGREVRKDWHGFRREAIERWTRDVPPWHAGGFGHPDHRADFGYWGQMALHTVPELLCLSVGVDPREFPTDSPH